MKMLGKFANHYFRPYRGHIKTSERKTYGHIFRQREKRDWATQVREETQ